MSEKFFVLPKITELISGRGGTGIQVCLMSTWMRSPTTTSCLLITRRLSLKSRAGENTCHPHPPTSNFLHWSSLYSLGFHANGWDRPLCCGSRALLTQSSCGWTEAPESPSAVRRSLPFSRGSQASGFTGCGSLDLKTSARGLPRWLSGKGFACQCRGHRFHPWFGKIPHATEQLSPCPTTTDPVL